MGWLKDVFNSSGAEQDRYNDLLNQKRQEYPRVTYNFDSWSSKSPSQRLKECQDLGTKVEVLRLLKAGKLDDNALSDGHRVDERGIKVYTRLYSEYFSVYNKQQCDPILNTNVVNKDSIESLRKADEMQDRIEKDTDRQRTIIIAVGGIVLLLGTTLILRKL
jgi:hypothetical protein